MEALLESTAILVHASIATTTVEKISVSLAMLVLHLRAQQQELLESLIVTVVAEELGIPCTEVTNYTPIATKGRRITTILWEKDDNRKLCFGFNAHTCVGELKAEAALIAHRFEVEHMAQLMRAAAMLREENARKAREPQLELAA